MYMYVYVYMATLRLISSYYPTLVLAVRAESKNDNQREYEKARSLETQIDLRKTNLETRF